MSNITPFPDAAVSHLQPQVWAKANSRHIKKAISEFAHELLIFPELQYQDEKWSYYRLQPDDSSILYRFRAQSLSLDHWFIDESSIQKFMNEERVPLDSLSFILEFKDQLGIDASLLPTYMEEITSTLYGSAYMLSNENFDSEKLVNAGYQDIEHAMTAGHPCFVANNGRIGFDANDYQAYAPEASKPLNLIWLAGHKSRAAYTGVEGLGYSKLIGQELDEVTVTLFNNKLTKEGYKPEDYFFIPVHPWQWFNKLASIFSPDIAAGYLVCLGYGQDFYLAQQSIRTFYNTSSPDRYYTKTSLSILNMGFMRGLSPYYMGSTPAITEWITEVVENDDYLQSLGFTMLGEVATVGYRNLYYEKLGTSCAYNKMLAALWRESPQAKLKPGQKIMTMAALLHIDNKDQPLLPELIKDSGLSTEAWLRQYFKAYFNPLLHCFYFHDMVFMPHGENLILVMEKNIPVKVIMKDITEEVLVLSADVRLPEKAKRVYAPTPEHVKILSLFTDVFDCFFRFMVNILWEHSEFSQERFWELVADCIHEYQADFPELDDKFEKYDLFAEEFTRSCLNRLQLSNNQQMIDLSDPAKNLKFAGTLKNPVAAYKIMTTEV